MAKRAKDIALTIGLATAIVLPGTASAQSGGMAAHYGQQSSRSDTIPNVLTPNEREFYSSLFRAIDRQDWNRVEKMINDGDGILHQIARAEYFTHANSPKISGDRIARWFDDGVHLPQSEQLGRMAAKRGVDSIPAFPSVQSFRRQPDISKRTRPRSVNDGSMPSRVRSDILGHIKNDDPASAHALLMDVDDRLSSAARAEWRQRVAWSYYIENYDEAALELAGSVRQGSGAWVSEGDWVAGLAAWRLGYCALAGEAFSRAANTSSNVELTTAAHYWAHRSLVRCREPGLAQDHLYAAAKHSDTLYGMLANEQLGVQLPPDSKPVPFSRQDWQQLESTYNVRIAAALIEIGRPDLADEVVRHQARVGNPGDYPALARLAREYGLPSSQLFMAYNAPYGMQADRSLRYPVAHWQPQNGWSVDPSLAFAHALQESNFRASAVSPANARGLMQIMPGTARDHNRRLNLGASYADLNKPEVNLAYGQRHLEMLRDSGATGGLLPKIMAAYNAGLTPVARWNSEIRDFNDPLLWMESIPYWETRGSRCSSAPQASGLHYKRP
ncbi:MAG: lytic transglycosylase domain-containing protein [Pseudomonadota bacterium]